MKVLVCVPGNITLLILASSFLCKFDMKVLACAYHQQSNTVILASFAPVQIQDEGFGSMCTHTSCKQTTLGCLTSFIIHISLLICNNRGGKKGITIYNTKCHKISTCNLHHKITKNLTPKIVRGVPKHHHTHPYSKMPQHSYPQPQSQNHYKIKP